MITSDIINYLYETDTKLQQVIFDIDAIPKLESPNSIFEDLVSCILDMQIRYRGKAIRFKRLKELLNEQVVTHENIFSIGESGLAHINMSRQKYNALIDITQYWETHELKNFDWELAEDNHIRNLLLPIKGISHWSIDMVLLFTLGRKNIFPTDDYQVKKIMSKLYVIDDSQNLKTEMLNISKAWQPYCSVAVLYLLEARKLKLI
ncbi:hypothetical protein [uncultured Psychroserpens sp.]|uniref:DNA-3-methyladenine glycosylase family protein n=1 Tax=uncultured Psychroserpens sp. TaxID=255436 RepID=UPI00262AD727|nr:hypothetical protein [uncultured Psychroserpens sp.]